MLKRLFQLSMHWIYMIKLAIEKLKQFTRFQKINSKKRLYQNCDNFVSMLCMIWFGFNNMINKFAIY